MIWKRSGDWVAAFLCFSVLISGAIAEADSWLPATIKVYDSNDGASRLTVTPRAIANPLRFFEDKMEGVEPAGQPPEGPRQAQGRLERLNSDGVWRPVWDRPLVNDVAPVNALVADGGDHVVTFDNWHSVGWGDDVVVIYGPNGDLIRSLSLADILPESYIEALPHSVSSIWWGGKHRLAGGTLLLAVVVPDDNLSAEDQTFVEVSVDLRTGTVTPPAGPRWEAALEAVARQNAEFKTAEDARRARLIAPLLGPGTNADQDWHGYLMEAYFRLTPRESGDFPATKVLRLPTAENYEASVGWLRDALLERPSGTIMIASPSQENLVRVITEISADIDPDTLSGSTVYVAVGDGLWPQISDLLRPSGAVVVQLDPSEPIPQRPDRLPN